jgi:SAM-dependent methyltransferase
MAGFRPGWAPETVDTEVPSAARVWDYFLGGSHNFPADRQVAEAAIALKPDMPQLARAVRGFLHRAVEAIAQAGVTQYLDIGAGIPTVGAVHETARAIHPDSRVVYVDHDPVAVAHGQALLREDANAISVLGDLRAPAEILHDKQVRSLLDFDRPVGLLLCGVLHFVSDEHDPAGIMATLRDALAPGSYLALQHATHDAQPAETVAMLEMWNANSPEPMYWRSREQVADLFAGFSLLEPGVVFLPLWRPEPQVTLEERPERFASFAALGRKEGEAEL